MSIEIIEIKFEKYDNINELEKEDSLLLEKAREVTSFAYAPYSNFNVGAAARLVSGEIFTGTNQENASFSVGICAERTLLSAVSSLSENSPIESMAISYKNNNGESDHPISPCGVCRQALIEYEDRFKSPIRLILGGQNGIIYIFENAVSLLPLAFTRSELK